MGSLGCDLGGGCHGALEFALPPLSILYSFLSSPQLACLPFVPLSASP